MNIKTNILNNIIILMFCKCLYSGWGRCWAGGQYRKNFLHPLQDILRISNIRTAGFPHRNRFKQKYTTKIYIFYLF